MFHFVVHASLTEFIFWIAILLVAAGVAVAALKDKIRGRFSGNGSGNRAGKRSGNHNIEEKPGRDDFESINEEIRELEKKLKKR